MSRPTAEDALLPDDQLSHFTIINIAPNKKNVKIRPTVQLAWLLYPFKANGSLRFVGASSDDQPLDLTKTPQELNMKPGKANRVALDFTAEEPSRSGSQSPRSRASTPSATSDAAAGPRTAAAAPAPVTNKPRSTVNNNDGAAAAGAGGAPSYAVNNKPPAQPQTQQAAGVQIASATPTPGASSRPATAGRTPAAVTPVATTPKASVTPTASTGAALAAPPQRTANNNSAAAPAASNTTPTASAGVQPPKRMATPTQNSAALAAAQQPPSRGSNSNSNSNSLVTSPSASLQKQGSMSGSGSGALTPIASMSNFRQEESNTFNVIGGVPTLQRPKNAGGQPEPEECKTAAEIKKNPRPQEEVVEVAHGDALSRVSSTVNTPRAGSATPGRAGSQQQQPSPSRVVTLENFKEAATPKRGSTPSPTPTKQQQQQQQHQKPAAAAGVNEVRAQSRATMRQLEDNTATSGSSRAQPQQQQQQEQTQQQEQSYAVPVSRNRGLPPVGATTPTSSEQQQQQQSHHHQQQQQRDKDPILVAYIQLPDGRREPVYYKDGAAKPVFQVSDVAAAADNDEDNNNNDGPTYVISTPRSNTGTPNRAVDHDPASSSATGSGNRFGSSGQQQQQQASANRSNRFAMPHSPQHQLDSNPNQQQQHQQQLAFHSDPRGSFFDQDMNNAGDSALQPMSSAELNEQVNELRTVLFNEQQRREELESRLTHLFGVADSWAGLRHTLTTAQAGAGLSNSSHGGSRTNSSYGQPQQHQQSDPYGASETPRNASLLGGPPQSSSFRRVDGNEAAILAEHERQLEELRRQRLVLGASMQRERRSPGSAML